MRIIVQRVFQAWVRVQGKQISRIKQGILVLVGITSGDTKSVAQHMALKALNMRLWEKQGKSWSSSVMEIEGEVMAVSQFTLYGIMKGNKPDFHGALSAQQARQLFDYFVSVLRKKYQGDRIQTGQFQTLMEVGSINNGPVTILYEKSQKQDQENKKIKNKKQQNLINQEQTIEIKNQGQIKKQSKEESK